MYEFHLRGNWAGRPAGRRAAENVPARQFKSVFELPTCCSRCCASLDLSITPTRPAFVQLLTDIRGFCRLPNLQWRRMRAERLRPSLPLPVAPVRPSLPHQHRRPRSSCVLRLGTRVRCNHCHHPTDCIHRAHRRSRRRDLFITAMLYCMHRPIPTTWHWHIVRARRRQWQRHPLNSIVLSTRRPISIHSTLHNNTLNVRFPPVPSALFISPITP
jgi:hypothetical protein